MFLRFLPLALPLVLTLTACPPDLEDAPAYVLVDGFTLTTRSGEGAPTQRIPEVWAFAGGDFLGVFPLPARIPLFRYGTVDLRLEAGVHQDGRSVTPEIYPFYAPVARSVDLQPGQQLELGSLPLAYRDGTVFGLLEDFEDGRSRVLTERLAGTGELRVQREVVRSGAGAGAVTLTSGDGLVELASNTLLRGLNRLPINVWLEVDYRSEAPAIFGVTGLQNGIPVREFDPGFLPREEWTKIYFNLSTVVARADLDELRLAFSTLLPPERERATVYLDNLKLVYQQP